MVWACFLHFYQPPTQKKYWIDRVTNESYRRIIQGLLENPQAKVTLNVNSVLCELWEEYGHLDVLTGLKQLVTRGQVELTGSAKFHPLLPRLPKEQVVRQIRLNEESLNKYFGVVGPALAKQLTIDNGKLTKNGDEGSPSLNSQFSIVPSQLKGFFPPEMAYDRNLAQIVAELGYEWILAEELSLGKAVEYNRIYEVSGISSSVILRSEATPESDSGQARMTKLGDQRLKIFFRDRAFSYKVLAGYLGTEKLFGDELRQRFPEVSEDSRSLPQAQPDSGSRHYLLTAMDGETFGHHRPGMEQLLFQLFKIQEMEMVQISQLPSLFKKIETVETKASTWALMEHEVEKNLPFARWDDPENAVHRLQWRLTNLAIEAIKNSELKIEKPERAQALLDRALHSDQYWWASAKPWWSLEYIERGAKELLEAVKLTNDRVAIEQGQKLYYQILETAFEYQRSGKVDEISKKEDETIRMRTDQTLPKMPKEELLKIIKTIRDEMLAVSQNQEYERAVQLRDRIKELEGYL